MKVILDAHALRFVIFPFQFQEIKKELEKVFGQQVEVVSIVIIILLLSLSFFLLLSG